MQREQPDGTAQDVAKRHPSTDHRPASHLEPWLVTADELTSYADADGGLALTMRVEVNGHEVGRDVLSNMAWTFPELLSYASRGAWVRAVLGSGTCGTGCLAELWGRNGRREPPPLEPSDLVTMTVDGLGTISNRVVAGGPAQPVPVARRRVLLTGEDSST